MYLKSIYADKESYLAYHQKILVKGKVSINHCPLAQIQQIFLQRPMDDSNCNKDGGTQMTLVALEPLLTKELLTISCKKKEAVPSNRDFLPN